MTDETGDSINATDDLGERAQSAPKDPTFKLMIVSYGHSNGPLALANLDSSEQLIFSVRDVENPPVRLRKTHTGLSARLRKEIFANQAARTKLDVIASAVESKMADMHDLHFKADPLKESPSATHTDTTLVVGIMCEEGKHRSVVFAEELARRIDPDLSWTISIEHRDLPHLLQRSPGNENDIGEEDEPGSARTSHRKSKKERDKERKKGRSSARKFFRQDDTLDSE